MWLLCFILGFSCLMIGVFKFMTRPPRTMVVECAQCFEKLYRRVDGRWEHLVGSEQLHPAQPRQTGFKIKGTKKK